MKKMDIIVLNTSGVRGYGNHTVSQFSVSQLSEQTWATLRGNREWRCSVSISTYSSVEERAEQLHLCLKLSQPEVNCLVVKDGLLEDLPLSCVLDGLLNNVVQCGQDWQEKKIERSDVK